MVPVTGHAIGTRTGVNRDSNRLGTATTVQNSNISEWAMQRRDRIGHRDSRLTRKVTVTVLSPSLSLPRRHLGPDRLESRFKIGSNFLSSMYLPARYLVPTVGTMVQAGTVGTFFFCSESLLGIHCKTLYVNRRNLVGP